MASVGGARGTVILGWLVPFALVPSSCRRILSFIPASVCVKRPVVGRLRRRIIGQLRGKRWCDIELHLVVEQFVLVSKPCSHEGIHTKPSFPTFHKRWRRCHAALMASRHKMK